jgi:hypothetical protein
MNYNIRELYELVNVVSSLVEEKEFKLDIEILDSKNRMELTVNCSRYAKFLINDINSIRKNRKDFLNLIDSKKMLALFGIMDNLGLFSRKDLREFLKTL